MRPEKSLATGNLSEEEAQDMEDRKKKNWKSPNSRFLLAVTVLSGLIVKVFERGIYVEATHRDEPRYRRGKKGCESNSRAGNLHSCERG